MAAHTRRLMILVGAFVFLVALGFAGTSANATPVQYPTGGSPTLTLSVSTAVEGSTIGVQGFNYAANETVTLHSAESTLGTARTDATGHFSTSVTLTNGVTGQQTVVGTGATGDSASASILITTSGSGGGGTGGGGTGGGGTGGLSNTGVAVLSIGGLGLLLLVGGAAMLFAGRRSNATA